MNIEQPAALPLSLHRNLSHMVRVLLRLVLFAAVTVGTVALLGRSTLDGNDVTWARVNTEVSGWGWDLIGWEAAAIAGKLRAGIDQPIAHLDAPARAAVVRDYAARSARIDELEAQINTLAAAAGGQITPEMAQVQATIDGLRHEQHLRQAAVEQIVEGQVGEQLAAAGLTVGNIVMPPVLFTFSEAPRKLIVSPRHRIDTAYWAMLDPELPVDARERIETAIFANEDLSAYVTHIGGLGAFPTLVIDRGGLPWLLSTVAHEWVHNYLTLFPLGINYGQTADLTILNETVADIVGDEIGAAALAQHYPELVPLATVAEAGAPAAGEPVATAPAFDFAREMRHTREIVDTFLALGRVEDAEQYMEIRRLLFVENGYNLRKLNQAYFAFHGNYGTGAAASSPIGPDLLRLRELAPDLRTFLETVRWFTSADDLTRTLAQWETQ
jgi:hypothetical protein